MVSQNAVFVAVIIGFAVTILGVFVWPFYNLIPSYVRDSPSSIQRWPRKMRSTNIRQLFGANRTV
ncbi:MAG: hypothetical protein ACK4TO_08010 [Candidatus Nitrosotenuis sp.]